MPTNNIVTIEHLLTLIGQQVVFQQQQCEIIELLDGREFVLQVLKDNTNIQATQYGEGHRDVPVTYVLPIFDGEGDLHAELVAAGLDQLLTQ
ncbi:hypothetical protein A9Q79_05215 [Methylophaga sp. 42_25_T18]|nr:hypothetical protein A9Q79_05215 [Methylophaga sp. 42_25_T18]OUR88169.1 hypothetical protein A9Q92_03250 [Methylophaga sp. 42_8_T64]